jgi:hypothetical protein
VVEDPAAVGGQHETVQFMPMPPAFELLRLMGGIIKAPANHCSANRRSANWTPGWRVPMSNLYQNFEVSGQTSQLFYRAQEFFADPPILELSRSGDNNLIWLLYGRPGSNYVLQATTNLSGSLSFSPTNFTLTNSFRYIGIAGLTNEAMFFRAFRK